MTDQLVEWYRQHNISPVRQDISDLGRHFFRRDALYRHLGILAAVRGRSVLEVGPGSGFNSIHTAAHGPSRYVVVEGNPTGVEDLTQLFARHELPLPEIVPGILQDYSPTEHFDVVLCEGMLSGVPDPEDVLRLLTRHVVPGGLLVITCIDCISSLSEALRRLCAQRLVGPEDSLEAMTAAMVSALAPHLARLQGMSRSAEDWVLDNMINPASIGPLLSIPVAIDTIGGDFDFYASSPHFVQDWRWYKQITPATAGFNELAIDQYWRNAHNLLNHARLFPARSPDQNRELGEACVEVRGLVRKFERQRDPSALQELEVCLGRTASLVGEFCPSSAAAIEEARALIGSHPLRPEAVAASPEFGSFFGRGQQYVSFTRKPVN